MREHFVPMLDGERLRETDAGYVHADGRPVDPTRLPDVVFVNADEASAKPQPETTGWWNSVSISNLDLKLSEDAGTASPLFTQVALSPGMPAENAGLSADELSGLLRSVATGYDPVPTVHFDAAFFHRTFSRWMGIETPAGVDDDNASPHWDYDFWKAELIEETPSASRQTPYARHQFLVEIHRGEHAQAEQYRYWIELDPDGTLQDSGWLTAPPDLLVEEDHEPTGFQSDGPDLQMLRDMLAQTD